MKNTHKGLVLFTLVLWAAFSCQQKTQVFVGKGDYCASVGSYRWKVRIELEPDSSYHILTSRQMVKPIRKKEEKKEENGHWQVERDTLVLTSSLLHQKLYLIERRYLCNRNDLETIKRSGREDADWIKKQHAYKANRF